MARPEEDFIGLSKFAAQDKAEKKNFIFRLIRIDTENYFAYPTDRCNERICIEIDKGKVSKAVLQ